MSNQKEKLSDFLIKTWHEYYDLLKESHDSSDYIDQWEFMANALLEQYPQLQMEQNNDTEKRNSKS